MDETYVGEIRDGRVVVEGPLPLAEGTKVRIEPLEQPASLKALSDRLLAVAGKARGLPSDLAAAT